MSLDGLALRTVTDTAGDPAYSAWAHRGTVALDDPVSESFRGHHAYPARSGPVVIVVVAMRG
jgi:hypothetical protein